MKNTIASIVALVTVVANAGPFGYEMGQKIEGEPGFVTKEGVQRKLVTQDVPAPFTSLILTYMPNTGLCRLTAFVDSDGYHIQFDKLRVRLRDKYGEPDDTNPDSTLWYNVDDDIDTISLGRYTADGISMLMYTLTNHGDCEAEAAAMRQKDGLQDVL